MLDKLINNNIRIIFGLVRSYIKGMNEWFLSYMVAIYLMILFVLIAVSLVVFGSSVLVDLYIELFAVLLGVHVYMSFKAILHDYVYNKFIVTLCTNMLLLIVLGVFVEVIKN